MFLNLANELIRDWMGERALVWGLRLLGLALFIGPFIIAFGMHNWDWQATLLPSEAEMNQVMEMLSGITTGGFSADTLTFESPTSDDNNIRINVRFNSPLKIPVKFTGLSGHVTCGDHPGVRLGQMSMEGESVEIPAQGTGIFTVVGQLTTEAIGHIADAHGATLPSNIGFENATATFEFSGISVQVQISALQGAFT